MYSRGHYTRRRVASRISNFIWRIVMTVVTICILAVVGYALLRWSNEMNAEIERHEMKK